MGMSVNLGVFFYICSQFCLVLDGIAIHHLGISGLDVTQMTLLRAIGSVPMIPVLSRTIGFQIFRSSNTLGQVGRAILSLISIWCVFYAFSNLPLADAAAVNHTRPIWMVLMGAAILHEVVSSSRWITTIIAVIGATIIIGPSFESWDSVYLVGLAGAVLNGVLVVSTRVLIRNDSVHTTMAFVTLITLLGSLPAVRLDFPWEQWPSLLTIALAGSLATWFGLLAVRDADVSVLAVFDNVRLPVTMLAGLIFFAEIPSIPTIIGATMIVGAGAILLHLERKQ